MTTYESACPWLERASGDLFFTHVPAGRTVIIVGEQFYFEGHPQLTLPVSQINKLLAAGKLRARNGGNGESS